MLRKITFFFRQCQTQHKTKSIYYPCHDSYYLCLKNQHILHIDWIWTLRHVQLLPRRRRALNASSCCPDAWLWTNPAVTPTPGSEYVQLLPRSRALNASSCCPDAGLWTPPAVTPTPGSEHVQLLPRRRALNTSSCCPDAGLWTRHRYSSLITTGVPWRSGSGGSRSALSGEYWGGDEGYGTVDEGCDRDLWVGQGLLEFIGRAQRREFTGHFWDMTDSLPAG